MINHGIKFKKNNYSFEVIGHFIENKYTSNKKFQNNMSANDIIKKHKLFKIV